MGLSLEDIKNAMNNLVNLDIRTIVGDVEFDNKGKMQPMAGSKQIVSRMNLLEGDITTAFPEEFLQAPLDGVRSFHGLRERQAMDIAHGNIKALQQFIGLIDTIDRQEKPENKDNNASKLTIDTPSNQAL
jgi:hypothetical protein